MADIEKRECSTCSTKMTLNRTNRRMDINTVAGQSMCGGCVLWMKGLQKKEVQPS